jgi:hypothetical protein
MSTSTVIITGRACRGCKHCERGAQLIGLKLLHWTLVLFTGFLWLPVPLFFKRCLYCGHSLYLSQH